MKMLWKIVILFYRGLLFILTCKITLYLSCACRCREEIYQKEIKLLEIRNAKKIISCHNGVPPCQPSLAFIWQCGVEWGGGRQSPVTNHQ